ncbi:MAG: bifunctional glutamate N-acetyltransferase/amino-acid acetyltransferase ArgJ [Polyangiaceae bacterium]|nr:bifunctional glutamate N-acetyltransferase/amino-acid acetyltransferase ArgJ [Polyangiaceae bacterium]
MKTPIGFQFAGLAAGLKPTRKDVALVYSKTPCTAAACFTVNKAKAAPILDAEPRVPATGIHAVVINSGNANALTGSHGVEAVLAVRACAAAALGIESASVLTASTGVIGVPLPTHKIEAAMPALVAALNVSPVAAAEAILTTDTRIKMTSRSLRVGKSDVTIAAICKGSGMIAPQLATMIAVFVTDCAIDETLLQQVLSSAMPTTFNALTVDADMSTNDAVFALANGEAKNAPITKDGADYQAFAEAVRDMAQELAKDIAADGEGATKRLETKVAGAPSFAVAQDLATAICGSSLVKAALFGADPNWGRILATVGARAGSQSYDVNPYRAKVTIQGVVVYDKHPLDVDRAMLRAKMREPEVLVEVVLEDGNGSATSWGCDLSYDYVKINADYTSLVVTTADGGVKKDDRLTNYSPKFKVSLLTEALAYISKFKGQRCVIKFGGSALLNESLKHAFVTDVKLLRSVGLVPVVVHGGDLEIARTLARLGGGADQSGVVEMVLTGKINTELVTLLNQSGVNAVGLSGKDAKLLTARPASESEAEANLEASLFRTGELSLVKSDLIKVLLDQGYVPVISPTGTGEDGTSYSLSGDDVAAGVAAALGAEKLIFLADAPGILESGELLEKVDVDKLRALAAAGGLAGGMAKKAQATAAALQGGVRDVHIVDGRVPHGVLAELFTDNGIGTFVQRSER